MEELKNRMRRISEITNQVVPLLVMDDWDTARGQVLQVCSELSEMLAIITGMTQREIRIGDLTELLNRLLYSIEHTDTIQMADILLYEIREVMGEISCGEEQ